MDAETKMNRLLLQASADLQKIYDKLIQELTKITAQNIEAVTPNEFYNIAKACTPAQRERVRALLNEYHDALLALTKQGAARAVKISDTLTLQLFRNYTELQGTKTEEWRKKTAGAFIESRMKRDGGLSLSDRVWNYTEQTKSEFELAVSQSIEKGMSQGTDAESLGRQVRQYLNNPDMMYRRYHLKKVMADGSKRDVVEWRRRVVGADGKVRFVKEDLAAVGTGVYRSARQNALRLTITETNMAYNYANCTRWSEQPFVLGIRIRLSGNHPVHDICDELEGDYPKDFMWRGWHPRCRCSQSPIMMDRGSEEWKRLRSLPKEEYEAYKSPNLVPGIPEKFKNWLDRNKKNLAKARKRGKLPYFVRDNKERVGEYLGWKEDEKPAMRTEAQTAPNLSRREQILEAARARHAARTDAQINDTLARWDARNYSKPLQDNFKEIEQFVQAKRGVSMDFEKADNGRGNIEYHTAHAFRVNCQSSVVAHELRMRGFDVTAQPNWEKGDDPNLLAHGTWLCWRTADGTRLKSPETFGYKLSRTGSVIGVPLRELLQQIEEHTGETGRYHVSFQWKGEEYGHIVTMERKADGSALWYDPQTGKRNFFDKEYAKKIKLVSAYRVDNLLFNARDWNVVRPSERPDLRTSFVGALRAYESGLKGQTNSGRGLIGNVAKASLRREAVEALVKDLPINVPKSRLDNALKSKNEFAKFEKEVKMCKVAVKNGHTVEMLEEMPGVSSCDILLDGKKCELKSVAQASNIHKHADKAFEKQGAELILLKLSKLDDSILSEIKKLSQKGRHGYFYVDGANLLQAF